MSVFDRYVSAVQSSNLAHSDRPCATDRLYAAAGIKDEFGTILYRLRDCHEAKLWNQAHELLARIAARKAMRASLTINANAVAKEALEWWLVPLCLACTGHGRMRMLDAPVLSEQPCHVCDGSGQRMPSESEFVQELVDILRRRYFAGAAPMIARTMDTL